MTNYLNFIANLQSNILFCTLTIIMLFLTVLLCTKKPAYTTSIIIVAIISALITPLAIALTTPPQTIQTNLTQ